MGRKQPPKPNVDRFSQISIEKSIQNLKNLRRKQMERKLTPDVIINISDDTEFEEYFRGKSLSELGIKKFVHIPFPLDSDEESDDKFSEIISTVSSRATPVKPISIGVNRPVACSTPFVTNPDISSSLQQSPIGKDTNDTTIRNTSNVYEKSTIQVLQNITLTPSKTYNDKNETRRISMQTVPSGNVQKTSAANVLPSTSSQKASGIEQKRNCVKKKVALENKATISNIPVDAASVKKKRVPRKGQNGSENNGGSPRKITKIAQTAGGSSDKSGSNNVAHFADCVYGTDTSTTDPKINSSGTNQSSALGAQGYINCSPSKKRKTEDKDERDSSLRKTKLPSMSEAVIIKQGDQSISVETRTTISSVELQALLNQGTSNAGVSHNPTETAEKPNTSGKSSNGTSMKISSVSETTAMMLGRSTQGTDLSANKVTQVAKSSTTDLSTVLPKIPLVPSLSTKNLDISLSRLPPKAPITQSEATFGKDPAKQTDSGTSLTTKSHRVSPTATKNTPGPDQCATKTSATAGISASILSGSSSSDLCTRTLAKPSLEQSPYKRILSNDEASQRLISQSCGSSGMSPTKTSALPTTPTKSTIASPSSIEKTPTKNSYATVSKTPTKKRLFRGSPRKMSMSPKSPKKHSKSTNNRNLELIKEKVFNVLKQSLHAKDIVKDELDIMEEFFKLDVRYQYLCLKLLTYQWKWYNIHKFCKKIEVDMDDNEIASMYEYLKNKGYVETDYEKSQDISYLLNILDCTDIRGICDTFKLNSRVKKKDEMIELLLKYCKTQCTLTFGKSSRDLLLDKIKDKMGASIKVKDKLRQAFYRLYTMATFSNIAFAKISDFFNYMLHIRIMFPEYDVAEALVFWNRNEFLSYVDAFEDRKLLEEYCISKRHVDVLARCRDIFEELKKLPNRDEDSQRYKETPHLKRYSAKSVYVSCLTKGCEFLRPKFPDDVRVWLEYLIENFTTSHNLGKWYCNLCCICMSKEKNYKKATNLILQAFTQHESCLNETQKFLLSERAEMLKSSKKYKIDQLDHDTLAKFVPVPKYDFTEVKIDAKTIRGNESGRKRHYVVQDADGSSSYVPVEGIALQYYIDVCGYTDGGHFEGAIVKSLFNLLFWDIIYNPKRPVPATFISKLQEVPLDMYTTYFYQNRQEEIDKRIEEIRSMWTDAQLLAFARNKHIEHAHENSMCQIQSYIKEPGQLEVLIPCLGRQVLADILKRLVKDIRQYRSGLPDLMVWNAKEQKCKFVEVKGENDRLSAGQNLWINYLKSIGANVEVCVVHSIGSKRKKLKGSIKQSESMLHSESGSVAATSATP